MKKKRTLILIGAVGILLAVQTITSFAADGKWTLTDAGYTFTYSDGLQSPVPGRISTASGTILTETESWRPDGRRWETSVTISTRTVPFSEGWQYDGPGGGNWYYYDSAGNA